MGFDYSEPFFVTGHLVIVSQYFLNNIFEVLEQELWNRCYAFVSRYTLLPLKGSGIRFYLGYWERGDFIRLKLLIFKSLYGFT